MNLDDHHQPEVDSGDVGSGKVNMPDHPRKECLRIATDQSVESTRPSPPAAETSLVPTVVQPFSHDPGSTDSAGSGGGMETSASTRH